MSWRLLGQYPFKIPFWQQNWELIKDKQNVNFSHKKIVQMIDSIVTMQYKIDASSTNIVSVGSEKPYNILLVAEITMNNNH